MKLEASTGILADKSTALLTHKGKEISWNVSILARAPNDENLDRFQELNGYWAHLPEKRQDQIFDVYVRVKDVIHNAHDESDAIYTLQPLVAELFDMHPLDELATWLAMFSELRVPTNVYETYEESGDYRNSRQRTYTTSQYRELVTMSVALRVMVPIWGDYINLTSGLIGTNFKEFYALKLLHEASIFTSAPMERMREYINAALPPEPPKEIFNLGMSSEDFPIWILSRILILRLTVADLRGNDVKKSLMPFLHTYIDGMVNPRNNNFANMIKEKKPEGNSSNEENNLSILESHRQREELAAGAISKLAVYTRNALRMARVVCPDVPEELVAESLETAKQLLMTPIMPVQLSLAAWVLRPALSPRANLYFQNTDVITCIGVAQALLLHRGHLELAGLVSAISVLNDETSHVRSVGSRGRIPPDMLEEIHRLYPYSERPTGKIRENTDTREFNMVLLSIKEIDKGFGKPEWTLTMAPHWVEQLTKNKNNRSYSTPHEMRIRLATLIISIAKRSF